MSSRGLRALSLALALTLGAVTEGRGAGFLPENLELLPPGIRGVDGDASALLPGEGGRVVERVRLPSATGAEPRLLDVEYTVDVELERRVRDVLVRSGITLGHVVLMDPAHGELLAYVSTAPEIFPATRRYPTASLMKIVTLAGALQRSPQAAGGECLYAGSPYELRREQLRPPAEGGRFEPLWRSLAISNNQCFARLAVFDVGEEALLAEIARVGLLEPPAGGHPEGRVEPVGDELDLGRLGSGLAGSSITPLAAARLAAALARGELVQPFWIARARDVQDGSWLVPERPAARAIWPAEIAGALRESLVGVTKQGTARSAFVGARGGALLEGIRVAGKTGSLSGRDPEGQYRWFIGVAPAEAPRIAIAVLVVNGPRSASMVAAAALRELFCPTGSCNTTWVDELSARATSRDAETAAEIAAAEAARQRVLAAAKPPAPAPSVVPPVEALDEVPRPIGVAGFDFPSRLLRKRVNGEIVLMLELAPDGGVRDARIDSSDLPDFDAFVLREVARWRFTPPRLGGQAVGARARLPIPIRIE